MIDIYYPFNLSNESPITEIHLNLASQLDKSHFRISAFAEKDLELGKNVKLAHYKSHRRPISPIRTSVRNHDIIHTGGGSKLRWYALRLSKFRNSDIKHVHTVHVELEEQESFDTVTRKKMLRSADKVIAVSENTLESVRDYTDADTSVIYNGVDVDKFRPGIQIHPDIKEYLESRPVITFVGNLEARKNPSHVLEVARQLPDFNFLIRGNGSLANRIITDATQLSNVKILGWLSQSALESLYANSDCFLFPTSKEGCPMAVLEAMSSGTPVVGYETTSMPELISDGENGFLVDEGDIHALTRAVSSVIRNSSGFGENARKCVETKFALHRLVNKYGALYQELK